MPLSKNAKEALIISISNRKLGQEIIDFLSTISTTPLANTIYVDKNGNDATANGSQALPFLTIQAAYTKIAATATPTNPINIIVGQGNYVEKSSFVLLPNINIFGESEDFTIISKADLSGFTLTAPMTSGIATSYSLSGIQLNGSLTINRPSTSSSLLQPYNESFQPKLDHVVINGSFTYNGLGVFNISTFPDWAFLTDVKTGLAGGGAVHLNGAGANIYNCSVGDIFTNDKPSSLPTAFATVTASDDTAHTVTVAPGSTFDPNPGMVFDYTSGNSGSSFTYTSYNPATGVFSGCILIPDFEGANLPIPGDKITTIQGAFANVIDTVHQNLRSGSVTEVGASSVVQRLRGGWFLTGKWFVSGPNVQVFPGVEAGTGTGILRRFSPPFSGDFALSNGAQKWQIQPQSMAYNLQYNPTTAANWISPPTITQFTDTNTNDVQDAIDILATEKFVQVTGLSNAPVALLATNSVTVIPNAAQQKIYLAGSGGAVTLTSTPQITAGTKDGQKLVLVGTSAINTLTFSDGNGVSIRSGGTRVLSNKNTWVLSWDSVASLWVEVSFL